MQAIIFDCFGVLTEDAWLPFKRKHFGHDKELERQAGDLNKQADAGLISYEDFTAAIADLANLPAEEAFNAVSGSAPNEALFAVLKNLKSDYKIGMLSNAASNWLDRLFTVDQIGLFDAYVLSCDSGFLKPDSRAYEAIANALGVEASECVFIDDQERFCVGAEEVGMTSIWYRDAEQVKRDLDSILDRSEN